MCKYQKRWGLKQYAFSVTWTIENFLICPNKPGEPIFSPCFVVGSFGVTKWRLILYPRGSSNPDYVACYLQRLTDESMLDEIGISFRIVMLNFEFSLGSSEVCLDNIILEKNAYWGSSNFIERKSLDKILQPPFLHKLTLRCDMSLSDVKVCTVNEKLNRKFLSKDLEKLYNSGYAHDLVIHCENKIFKIHRAVIATRAPKLAAELCLDFSFCDILERDISNMNTDVLDFLLFYLYTGRIDFFAKDLQIELIKVAHHYDLSELKRRLKSYPKHYSCRTNMNVEHKTVVWRISKTSRSKTFSKLIPLEREHAESLIIKFRFDRNNGGLAHYFVSFCFSRFDTNLPISVACKITASDDDRETLLDYFDGYRLFESNEEWDIPFYFPNGQVNGLSPLLIGDFIIDLELNICYGERSSFIESTTLTSDLPYPYLNDYGPLSWDLGKLKADIRFSDISLVVENVTFPAHRVMLTTRSRVFRRMFQNDMKEKRTGIVHMIDVSPETVKDMLTYLYTGNVESAKEDTSALYKAADMYELMPLRDSCADILMASTNLENYSTILLTAYYHSDEHLKRHVRDFIRLNVRQVVRTATWNMICSNLENLASEILPVYKL